MERDENKLKLKSSLHSFEAFNLKFYHGDEIERVVRITKVQTAVEIF